MAEIRKQLTTKQLKALEEANKRLTEARKLFEDAAEFNRAVSELITDALGIPDGTNPTFDNATKELVYTLPETSGDAEAATSK